MRRIQIKDGDAEAALSYLCRKVETNSSFFFINSTSMKKVDQKTCFGLIQLLEWIMRVLDMC